MLYRIGEDAMFHLLTETCLFVPLPSGSFCQMTGPHIVHRRPPQLVPSSTRQAEGPSSSEDAGGMKRKRIVNTRDPGERLAKRQRTGSSSSSGSANLRFDSTRSALLLLFTHHRPDFQLRRTPADIPIIRARMFYYRPYFVQHTNLIVIGLPPTRRYQLPISSLLRR